MLLSRELWTAAAKLQTICLSLVAAHRAVHKSLLLLLALRKREG